MRTLALLFLFDCCALLAAEPRYVVANHCPPAFAVTNRCPAPPAATESNFDLWLIDGRFVYVPRGQTPAAAAPQPSPLSQPAFGGGCAGGSCGVSPFRGGFFRR